MSKELKEYIARASEQENIVFKYQQIINSLAIPKPIERPKLVSVAKKVEQGKAKYVVFTVINSAVAAICLYSSFFMMVDGLVSRNGTFLSYMAMFFGIGIFYAFTMVLIWGSYMLKVRKLKKIYEKELEEENILNAPEIERYTKEVEAEEIRLKEERKIKVKLNKKLVESQNVLARIYNLDIVFPKYRNFTAINMICEYLQSGRCESLTGPNGAYNIFESEIRANIIIDKMDDIIASLDDIKNNQYLIYSAITETNVLLNKIRGELIELNESASIEAFNSRVIASEARTLSYLSVAKFIDNY